MPRSAHDLGTQPVPLFGETHVDGASGPPQRSPGAPVPQSGMSPPQPSPAGPHSTPWSPHVFGLQEPPPAPPSPPGPKLPDELAPPPSPFPPRTSSLDPAS